MYSTTDTPVDKSVMIAERASQRLEGLAMQIQREINLADNQDSANACLGLQMSLLKARQQILSGIDIAREVVA